MRCRRDLDEVADDASARVLVLAAAGKAYCAGHDLKEMRADPRSATTSSCSRVHAR